MLLIFVIMLNTSLLLSRLAMVIMGTFYILGSFFEMKGIG